VCTNNFSYGENVKDRVHVCDALDERRRGDTLLCKRRVLNLIAKSIEIIDQVKGKE
jgi:hypothetical protein